MKVSISNQIAEVRRELDMRANVYPRQVSAGKMRKGEADYQIECLRAALATLEFVRDNAAAIKAAVGAQSQTSKQETTYGEARNAV